MWNSHKIDNRPLKQMFAVHLHYIFLIRISLIENVDTYVVDKSVHSEVLTV